MVAFLVNYPTVNNDANIASQDALQIWLRSMASAINTLLGGHANNIGQITLYANKSSTTLSDARLGIGSVVVFDPLTAHAASELHSGNMYCPGASRQNGQFVVNHTNNAYTDKTFNYVIVG